MAYKYPHYTTDLKQNIVIAVNQLRYPWKSATLASAIISAAIININPNDILGIESSEILNGMIANYPLIAYLPLHVGTGYLLYKLARGLSIPNKSASKYSKMLYDVGIRDKAKNTPIFIRHWVGYKRIPDIEAYLFFSNGTTVEDDWKPKSKNLARKFGRKVADILEVDNDKTLLLLEKTYKNKIKYWRDSLIEETDVFILGENQFGEKSTVKLDEHSHMLITAPTGYGKSKLLVSLLHQSYRHGYILYIIDFKRGMDFHPIWQKRATFAKDFDEALATLTQIEHEMHHRMKLLEGDQNINIYNQTAEEPLQRIIIFVDEIAQMTIGSKSCKEVFQRITQLGRAPGIHCIAATQRCDATVIDSQIKTNFTLRIAGPTDKISSNIMLGNTDAADNIPRLKGWFATTDKQYFRSYLVDEEYEYEYKTRAQ